MFFILCCDRWWTSEKLSKRQMILIHWIRYRLRLILFCPYYSNCFTVPCLDMLTKYHQLLPISYIGRRKIWEMLKIIWASIQNSWLWQCYSCNRTNEISWPCPWRDHKETLIRLTDDTQNEFSWNLDQQLPIEVNANAGVAGTSISIFASFRGIFQMVIINKFIWMN